MIDKNEQLTMDELLFEMKHKYKDFDITRQHQVELFVLIIEPEKEQDINIFLKKDTINLLIKIKNQKISIMK